MPHSSCTLTAAAHSFLDAAFFDDQGHQVYRTRTNATLRQTFLSGTHSGPFAAVQWPAPSTFLPTDPTVTIDGVQLPASEMLMSTHIIGSSRKFRVPGYSDNFKFKKASAGVWQCFASNHHMVAHIEFATSCICVELFSPPPSALTISSSSISSPAPEQTLFDTIILIALLITADADSIPTRRSSPRPIISLPLPYHISTEHLSREASEDSRMSDISSADAGSCAKHPEPVCPRKPRHAFDLRREVPQYDEDEQLTYSHFSGVYDLFPPPYTTSSSPTPMYSGPPSPRTVHHFDASKLCWVPNRV